jgi:hypothetical protein
VLGAVEVLGALGLTGVCETFGVMVQGAGAGMAVTGGVVAAGGGMALDGVEGVAPAGVWLKVAPVLTPAEVALREVVEWLRTTGVAARAVWMASAR